MFHNYKNYKIHLRKDRRYAARVMDQGHSTVCYGRTKKEVQQKLEVYIAELNTTAQIKYEIRQTSLFRFATVYIGLQSNRIFRLHNEILQKISQIIEEYFFCGRIRQE